MHFRRLATFLLGAWIAGSLFMAMVAIQNFRSVDRLLSNPAPAAQPAIHALGHDTARNFLRYQVAEQNRFYFETWEIAQLFLGITLFMVLLFGSTESKYTLLLALLMLVIVIVDRFFLTPEIVALGRLIDFIPPEVRSPERSRFWLLHGTYSSLEIVKWCLGFVLAGKLIFRSRRKSNRSARDVDMINEPDHGHVDG